MVAAGDGAAALLRAAEPLNGWTLNLMGPGLLARGYGVTLGDNGLDLEAGDLSFRSTPGYDAKVIRRPLVGVDYARHWSGRLLRFIDANSPIPAKLR